MGRASCVWSSANPRQTKHHCVALLTHNHPLCPHLEDLQPQQRHLRLLGRLGRVTRGENQSSRQHRSARCAARGSGRVPHGHACSNCLAGGRAGGPPLRRGVHRRVLRPSRTRRGARLTRSRARARASAWLLSDWPVCSPADQFQMTSWGTTWLPPLRAPMRALRPRDAPPPRAPQSAPRRLLRRAARARHQPRQATPGGAPGTKGRGTSESWRGRAASPCTRLCGLSPHLRAVSGVSCLRCQLAHAQRLCGTPAHRRDSAH